MGPAEDQRAIDAVAEVWRRESAWLVAALTRTTRDLGLAEDLAQDALVTALEQWPDHGIPDSPGAWLASFDLPVGAERVARLDDVMAVTYLVFNEGYTATAGDDWMRPELCVEAIRLARLLAELMPEQAETHGLQALLEIQASCTPARHDTDGAPVLLENQDRSRWDQLLIRRGLAALDRAEAAGGPVGPYVLQAAIAACHARAARAEDTDWGPDGPVVRPAGRGTTDPGRRAQPRGRARAGVRTGGGSDRARTSGGRPRAGEVAAAAELAQNADERWLLRTRAGRLSP